MVAAVDIEAFVPTPAESSVVIVDPDERSSAVLARYLESRGWKVICASDARRLIRQWGTTTPTPFLVLKLDDHNPDAFELLAALAARALAPRVVACVPPALEGMSEDEASSLGIDRVLATLCRFSDVAAALDELAIDARAEDDAVASLSTIAEVS